MKNQRDRRLPTHSISLLVTDSTNQTIKCAQLAVRRCYKRHQRWSIKKTKGCHSSIDPPITTVAVSQTATLRDCETNECVIWLDQTKSWRHVGTFRRFFVRYSFDYFDQLDREGKKREVRNFTVDISKENVIQKKKGKKGEDEETPKRPEETNRRARLSTPTDKRKCL